MTRSAWMYNSFDGLALVGVDADVLAQPERLLLRVGEQAAVGRVDPEGGPEGLEKLLARLELVVLIELGDGRGHRDDSGSREDAARGRSRVGARPTGRRR